MEGYIERGFLGEANVRSLGSGCISSLGGWILGYNVLYLRIHIYFSFGQLPLNKFFIPSSPIILNSITKSQNITKHNFLQIFEISIYCQIFRTFRSYFIITFY